MHASPVLSHPVLALAAVIAALFACAFVMPARNFPRRILVLAALVLGAGIAAAGGVAYVRGGGGILRTDAFTQASLASTVLVVLATASPMCGHAARSNAGLLGGAVIMAAAMIVSEFL